MFDTSRQTPVTPTQHFRAGAVAGAFRVGADGQSIVVTRLHNAVLVEPGHVPRYTILTKRKAQAWLVDSDRAGDLEELDRALNLPGDPRQREIALQLDEQKDRTREGEW